MLLIFVQGGTIWTTHINSQSWWFEDDLKMKQAKVTFMFRLCAPMYTFLHTNLCMWLCLLIMAEVYSTHYRWESHTGEEALSHSYKCHVHTHSGVLWTPHYWVCISHQIRCTYRGKRFTPYLVCNSHYIFYMPVLMWQLNFTYLHWCL